MNALKVLVAFLVLLVPAFADGAGGPVFKDDLHLGGEFSLDNGSLFRHDTFQESDSIQSSIFMHLNPEKMNFDNGFWNFYTDYYDPSRWTATYQAHGYLDKAEDTLDYYSVSDSIKDLSGLSIQSSSNFYPGDYEAGKEVYMDISGYFSISPAQITSSNFSYREQLESFGPYKVPVWRATLNIQGVFKADTLEEARAMGLEFLQEVPEPRAFDLGIIALMFVGSLGVWCRRRRRT